jgi:hypothetical protein
MTDQQVQGCIPSAGGPLADEPDEAKAGHERRGKESVPMRVTVGKKAPDFEAAAFVDGGFKNIRLSDYAGKWVFLCFYPGDFTFV